MNMKLRFCFVLSVLCILFCTKVNAQVKILADGRLQTILERHIEYNEMSRSIQGYRVRVNSFTGDNAKAKAFALKKDLQSKYPQMRVYVTFDEPNFIVKIGDFLTRLDAFALYSDLRKQVNTTQIIRDWINNPVISEEDLHTPEYVEQDLESDF
jgi:hypothetical protein